MDPDRYDHTNIEVDVAIVGAGLAGLAAARAACRSGQTVAIFDRDALPGGKVLSAVKGLEIEGVAADLWAAEEWKALASDNLVTAKLRTTAFGLYDGGFLTAHEMPADGEIAGRVWHVRAKRIVLATGALERPMVFPGNDRPGVILSGAAEAAVGRYGVRPGQRAVLYANHAGTEGVEAALNAAGVTVVARVGADETITGTIGGRRLVAVDIAPVGVDGLPDMAARRRIAADLLVTSGGWAPALALHLIQGGRQRWSSADGCFIADGGGHSDVSVVGAANANFTATEALADGFGPDHELEVAGGGVGPVGQGLPIAPIRTKAGKRQAFIDFQHDVTVSDIELAAQEGFTAIEHAKRFTTAGMGTDQGRTAQLATAAALAAAMDRSIADVGLSGLRPPVTPVPFGALGGWRKGALFHPIRRTPMHERHAALGAVWEDVGDWKRARYYPEADEDMTSAVARECRAVRQSVGVLDVSTLGKIDVSGPDAAEFMNRIYTNRMDNLRVGGCRYGLMLKDDGMVFDDGVAARVSENRYHLTTTSGGAGAVLDWLEDWRQTEWPELSVRLASVTEQWAGVAIAGPVARALTSKLAPAADLSNEAFPHLSWVDAEVLGASARIFRVSFSGELGFEINVPWRNGAALWDAVAAAGATPYGTEAMHVLRAEKGFIVVGHDTDGTLTPVDLGMNWIISKKKGDFIGRRSLQRPALVAEGRKQLVGLEPEDRTVVIEEGAQIIAID
ncbi:MAG: NAD(P)-binding protein [Alphaproteobacteria bacterium]